MNRPFVAVFCGASSGLDSRHADDIARLGRAIAAAGAGLVYGGGRVGLMGVLADAVLEAGAPVHGVIPSGLARKEMAHHGLTRLDVVTTMHERKARIAGVAVGFIAAAGGYGTMDEFFEVVTWKQLGHHDRPIVLYNGSGLFDPLLLALRRMADEGFVHDHGAYFHVEDDPANAVRRALSGLPRR